MRRRRSPANVPDPSFTVEDYRLAKHKGEYLLQREIKIKCGANFHKIKLRFPGHITLLNHDKREEHMIAKLGGSDYRKPECLTFLENWYAGDSYRYYGNRPLAAEVDRCRDKAKFYKQTEKTQYEDWLEKSIYDRLVMRVGQVYNTVHEKIRTKFIATNEQRRYAYYQNSVNSVPDDHNEVLIPRLRLEFVDLIAAGEKTFDVQELRDPE